MLLLSSATRILATKLPPDVCHPSLKRRPLRSRTKPHPSCGRHFKPSLQYWSTRTIARQSYPSTCVSEVNMASPTRLEASAGQKTRGAALAAPLLHSFVYLCLQRPTRGLSCAIPSSFCCWIPSCPSSLWH